MFSQVSVCPQGGVFPIACWDTHTHPWADTPWPDTPRADTFPCPVHVWIHPYPVHAGIHTPPKCMLEYGQQAGGMHPTWIHSCSLMWWMSHILPFTSPLDSRNIAISIHYLVIQFKSVIIRKYYFNLRMIRDFKWGLQCQVFVDFLWRMTCQKCIQCLAIGMSAHKTQLCLQNIASKFITSFMCSDLHPSW